MFNINVGAPPQDEYRFAIMPGWFTPGNGYQYRLTEKRMPYEEAREECKGWGGSLAQEGLRDRFYFGYYL